MQALILSLWKYIFVLISISMPTNILKMLIFVFDHFACSLWQTFGTAHAACKHFITNQTFQLVNTEKLTMKINQHCSPKDN